MKSIKFLSLFSGIGAFEKALRNLGIDYKLVGFSEIDKYAVKSYCAVHDVDENKNLGDITKINTCKLPKDIDLISYGFPCQDISLAGKQKGFEHDGERTRSGLFFEALRIIEDTKPKIAIAENVKNLVSKKFAKEFSIVLESLEQAGYNNYWKVLNAKDFGIPQNRERVFIVSIRKDVDDGTFEFPEGFELKLRLKDMLEDEVDEKYFLTEKQITKGYFGNAIDDTLKDMYDRKKALINKEIAYTITVKPDRRVGDSNYISNGFGEISVGEWLEKYNESKESECKVERLFNIYGKDKGSGFAGNVWNTDKLSPTLTTMGGGNRQPLILDKGGGSYP